MKKLLVVLVLITLAAGGAFGQTKLSVGGGGYFTAAFGGGFEASAGEVSAGMEFPYSGGGAFVFFDANYLEASIGFFLGTFSVAGTGLLKSSGFDVDINSITVSVLGKYPINLGSIILFPAAGIEYNMVSSGKSGNVTFTDAADLSHLWIKFGVGADYDLSSQIYIRATALYGIRLPSKIEDDLVDTMKASLAGSGISVDPVLGHGIQIKVGVGYRF